MTTLLEVEGVRGHEAVGGMPLLNGPPNIGRHAADARSVLLRMTLDVWLRRPAPD